MAAASSAPLSGGPTHVPSEIGAAPDVAVEDPVPGANELPAANGVGKAIDGDDVGMFQMIMT